MIVEPFRPYIQNLLQAEPWRGGYGASSELCPGDIDWDGTAYWCCKKCGKIGTSVTQYHAPVRTKNEVAMSVIRRIFRRR
jgi:hypothetical protein